MTLQLERNSVYSTQDLKRHFLANQTQVLGLEGNRDGMLCAWEQLPPRWKSLEAGHFGEGKINCKILIFVSYGESEVFPLVRGTLSKLELLLANFDVGIAGSCHHLYFKVFVLQVAES